MSRRKEGRKEVGSAALIQVYSYFPLLLLSFSKRRRGPQRYKEKLYPRRPPLGVEGRTKAHTSFIQSKYTHTRTTLDGDRKGNKKPDTCTDKIRELSLQKRGLAPPGLDPATSYS